MHVWLACSDRQIHDDGSKGNHRGGGRSVHVTVLYGRGVGGMLCGSGAVRIFGVRSNIKVLVITGCVEWCTIDHYYL